MWRSLHLSSVLTVLIAVSCGNPTARTNHVQQVRANPGETFTTSDGQAYRVVSHSFSDQESGVKSDRVLTLTFNLPMEDLELPEKLINLKKATPDTVIDTTFSLSDDGKTITITPRSTLEPAQVYTVEVNGILSLQDSELPETFSLSFLSELNHVGKNLATGGQHVCQVMQGGQTRCLSVNNFHSANGISDVYQPVAGLSPAKSVEVSSGSACIITAANTVECFKAESGEVTKEPLTDIVTLAATRNGLCALNKSGAVYCRNAGENSFSQPQGLTSGVRMLSAGGEHFCAVKAFEEGVSCWGANQSGQSNPSESSETINIPVTQPALLKAGESVKGLALGMNHSCILASSGKVRCWGENKLGQLGTNNFQKSNLALEVPLPDRINTLVSGSSHVCAVTESAGMSCWGWNAFGQFGSTDKANSPVPVPQTAPAGVSDIIAGQYFSLVHTTDSKLYALGTFISDFEKKEVGRLTEMQAADYLLEEPQ